MNEASLDVAKLLQEQERQWLLQNPPVPRPLPEPPTVRGVKSARGEVGSPTNEALRDVMKLLEEQERQWLLQNPPAPRPAPERPTVHWTDLTKATAGSELATEWDYYLTQIGRLLAEGHAGRWVLIVGEEIIGIYDTDEEGHWVQARRFPKRPVLLHQVLEREPILRGGGYHRLWLV